MAGTTSYYRCSFFSGVFSHVICGAAAARGQKIPRNWYREAKINLSIFSFECINKMLKIFDLAAHIGAQEHLI